ncbi:MAG: hypothetical protein LUC50_00575 [Ruminococcus sp.]|nr:hypothetical protein [Ruminococcus sp.]
MISQRERIFRRSLQFRFEGAVHEAVVPRGKIRYGDAAVSHRKLSSGDPDRNLHIYQKKLMRGENFSLREQHYYARELFDHGAYRAALPVLESFLKDGAGWTPDQVGACLLCGKCLQKLDQPGKALMYLFESFRYGLPHSEICCEIGQIFLVQNRLETAVFWYQLALETGKRHRRDFICRRAAIIFRQCSCVFATTDWGTFRQLRHIMN